MGETHSQLLINLNCQESLWSTYFPCQVVSEKERKMDVGFIGGQILKSFTVLESNAGLVISKGGVTVRGCDHWSWHRLPDVKGFPWFGLTYVP